MKKATAVNSHADEMLADCLEHKQKAMVVFESRVPREEQKQHLSGGGERESRVANGGSVHEKVIIANNNGAVKARRRYKATLSKDIVVPRSLMLAVKGHTFRRV
ncbi:hypothetical protein VNO77_27873 [Canavalia gladiata]|uniref:Uncharacterized protein n=1 Tax=Canavalia gladiata TaxID=3824 RepID=A0AAN9KUY1_CANGL